MNIATCAPHILKEADELYLPRTSYFSVPYGTINFYVSLCVHLDDSWTSILLRNINTNNRFDRIISSLLVNNFYIITS